MKSPLSLLSLLLIFTGFASSADAASAVSLLSGSKAGSRSPAKSMEFRAGSNQPDGQTAADSGAWLRLHFTGQLRLQYSSVDHGSNEAREKTAILKARRVRLILKGSPSVPGLDFRLQISAAPGSMELMDFYLDYRTAGGMQFRGGQYKVPFTQYRAGSFSRLSFVDWALVTKYFGAERQMGLTVHNGFWQPATWAYAFGFFTGVNARASHAIGLAEAYGVEIANPSDLADPGPSAEFHPELFASATCGSAGSRELSTADDESGRLRWRWGVSAAWDLDPARQQDFRLRLSPEVLARSRDFSLSAGGYIGWSETRHRSGTRLTMLGGLAEMAHCLNSTFELSLRYAVVDLQRALRDDIADALGVPAQATSVKREQELTLGVNLDISGYSVRLQNDAGWLRRSTVIETLNDFTVRSQFQIVL